MKHHHQADKAKVYASHRRIRHPSHSSFVAVALPREALSSKVNRQRGWKENSSTLPIRQHSLTERHIERTKAQDDKQRRTNLRTTINWFR